MSLFYCGNRVDRLGAQMVICVGDGFDPSIVFRWLKSVIVVVVLCLGCDYIV
jgi:hypothetical protein